MATEITQPTTTQSQPNFPASSRETPSPSRSIDADEPSLNGFSTKHLPGPTLAHRIPDNTSSLDFAVTNSASSPSRPPRILSVTGNHAATVDSDHSQSQKIVSFAALDTTPESHAQQRSQGLQKSNQAIANDSPETTRHSRLSSKIRSLALPLGPAGHVKSASIATPGDGSHSEFVELIGSNAAATTERNIQADLSRNVARGEGGADIASGTPKTVSGARTSKEGSRTAPSTPRYQSFRDLISRPYASESRPQPIRRSTMTDLPENSGEAVSEDEGGPRRKRDRRRRGSDWIQTQRRTNSMDPDDEDLAGAYRPINFRKITGLGASDGTPSIWKTRGEAGAQRWRQLKATIRMMGQKRKEENRDDHAKSAELMAELLAGSPAALILASSFQRDESKKRKIPVLLDQLKIRITDSQRREDSSGDRHVIFRIELEYGSGVLRMKWVISRSLRDFVNLHLKYKLQSKTMPHIQRGEYEGPAARQKMPRFPKGAFPYLRGVRGLMDDDEDEEENAEDESGPDGRTRAKAKSRKSSFTHTRQQSSEGVRAVFGPPSPFNPPTPGQDSMAGNATKKDIYADRQRRNLEEYLKELIRFTIFRAGSNRLCRFLELSALGIKLAAEGGYHGKEGTLSIQSGKGVDFRKAITPSTFYERHRPKWFLVRHSYIVCVDSPEDMNVYDVFLIDSTFEIQAKRPRLRDQKKAKDIAKTAKNSAAHPSGHVLRIRNAERKMRLLAKNERQLNQFEDSIRFMAQTTEWGKVHRFDSFAPVRRNVSAQWLVDGRDYMWNVSRAISMAQDVIYIHDWWLSPELYMRRPAAISQKWRLDRLLKRKAEEGVKIFVIMYRNIDSTIPIDSEYSKFSLLDLHPNVFVQRSPNQVRQNVFFWAHHEKICIVDHTVAFCGGVDLCFGRWDTPQHLLVDDKPTGFDLGEEVRDAAHCQLWPGKDYSNPRVLDFYKLDEPYSDMYNREQVPRMPWHDIAMQIVGQPARDLTRHFVQRWNYILRQRKPSRPTPFLLPPPDFNPGDLEALNLDGTCDVQILRSACDWSLGTPNKTEHSIMNAYIKLIEKSEHFVYIENQFFITSCVVDGSKMENTIGDALVERIIRAYHNNEYWRCVIVIPLMPGFQNTVDSQDGTSVRLIMQCQYRSISRGESSIFERLRSAGVDPEEYIQFYSLRTWGKIGPNKAVVTEQLYIHAKCMIVDDRYAIIGSANINERSMRGDRDSEVAAVVWDNDMIDSVMAGRPYRVGRFPYSLRMRLMREHLGLDTDEIMHEERLRKEAQDEHESTDDEAYGSAIQDDGSDVSRNLASSDLDARRRLQEEIVARTETVHTFNHDADWLEAANPHLLSKKKMTQDRRVTNNVAHEQDVEGHGFDHMADLENTSDFGGLDTVITSDNREYLINNVALESDSTSSGSMQPGKEGSKTAKDIKNKKGRPNNNLPPWKLPRMHTEELGLTQLSQLPALPTLDDTDIGGPPLSRSLSDGSLEWLRPLLEEMRRPVVDKDCMKDPLCDSFYIDTWHSIAANNTKLFRQVFRCMPDSQVTDWKEYEAFSLYSERFAQSQGVSQAQNLAKSSEKPDRSGPPGSASDTASQQQMAENDRTLRPDDVHAGDGLLRKISSTFSQRKGSLRSTRSNRNHSSDGKELDKEKRSHSLTGVDFSAEVTNEKTLSQPLHLTPQQSDTLDGNRPLTGTSSNENRNNNSNNQLNEKASGINRVDFLSVPSRDGPLSINGDNLARPDTQGTTGSSQPRRRRRATTKSSGALRATDPLLSKPDAEALLNLVQGHLVLWPYDWLIQEERGGKWLYNVDQMVPLEIYD